MQKMPLEIDCFAACQEWRAKDYHAYESKGAKRYEILVAKLDPCFEISKYTSHSSVKQINVKPGFRVKLD